MSTPTVLYLSILSNSVLLITLYHMRTPRPSEPPRQDQDQPRTLGTVPERMFIYSPRVDAGTQTEPTDTSATRTPTPVPTVTATEASDDDELPPNYQRVHFSPVPPRRHDSRPARLDLNVPWEEVTVNINGHNWGVFSLADLTSVILRVTNNRIENSQRSLTGHTRRLSRTVHDIEDRVDEMVNSVRTMGTQMGNTFNSTTHVAQTIENIRAQYTEAIAEQRRLSDIIIETSRFNDHQINLILLQQTRFERRLARMEDHLGLDDIDVIYAPLSDSDEEEADQEGVRSEGEGTEEADAEDNSSH